MPPIRNRDMDRHQDTANESFIAESLRKAGGAQRLRMLWDDELSQMPLEEPGYLLHVDCKDRSFLRRAPSDEPIRRTIRVPKDISFHQLHAILGRTMRWWLPQGYGYVFSLWDLPFRHPGKNFGTPGYAEIAKETLVEDVSERMSEYEDSNGHIERQNWKNSKSRKLSQVFGGSRIWQEKPYEIKWEVCCHKYTIEFLGETDVTFDVRPGQEVFCLDGQGQLTIEDDLWDYEDVCIDAGRYDTWDKEFVNNHLASWCCKHRQRRIMAMGRDER